MAYLNVRQAPSNDTIPQCANLSFAINTTPPTTPPYSLIVYTDRVPAIPTVFPLTVVNRLISWTVVYPESSAIVYSLVDSEGKSIGNAKQRRVLNGSSECLPPPSNRTSPLTVTSDVLRDLDPCSPLNTRIVGGKKPYTVSLVPIEVEPVINMTLGPNDDSLYWVNVLKSQTQFMLAVSDSDGQYSASERWGSSGSTNNTSCPGQITVTHSYNSNDPFTQKSNTTNTSIAPSGSNSTNVGENGVNSNSQSDGGRTTAIVGATMGVIILLGLLFIFYRHRKRHRKDRRGTGLLGGNERTADYDASLVPFNHSTSGLPMNQTSSPPISFDPPYNVQSTSLSGNTGVAGAGMNVSSRKAAREAAREAARAAQEGGVSAPTAVQQSSGLQVPQSSGVQVAQGSGVQVRQHTDAMAIIELPPAYRDATPQ